MVQDSPFATSGPGELSWAIVTDSVERFESAWNSNPAPEIADFVPDATNDSHIPVLVELIRVDQEYRWRKHEKKLLEAYLDEWPQLRANRAIARELLKSECLTRFFEDDPPAPEDIDSRFPDLSDSIDLAKLAQEAARDGAPRHDTVKLSKNSTVAPSGQRTLLRGQSFGRYRIVGFLGAGSMGAVYRANDPHLDRDVALKIPQLSAPKQLDRFIREAKLAAKIRHPNICPIYDADKVHDTRFITMALIDGPTLAEHVEAHSPTPDEAAELICKVASALDHVHSEGIVHRDLKPSNIMLDENGQPLLMDFGLARGSEFEGDGTSSDTSSEQTAEDLSAAGSMIGTPAFMSPEQAACRPVDARSDIYNLGVVFYQLMTGHLPFSGSLTSVMHDVIHAKPVEPRRYRPEIPDQLQAICLQAMAKDPADRFQTAREFADTLHEYLRKSKRTGRKYSLLVPAALLMLMLGTLIFLRTGSGTVEFTVPAHATVFIDGDKIRITSGRGEVSLTVGTHHLRVSVQGSPFVDEPIVIRWRGQRIIKELNVPIRAAARGWWRRRYDLGGTRRYPFASRVHTSDRLEHVKWQPGGSYESMCIVRTGDLNDDGFLEIVWRTADSIVVCDHTGRELWRRNTTEDAKLKIPTGYKGGVAGIELADFDNNGSLDIATLATIVPLEGFTGSFPVKAIIYEPDGSGISCTTVFEDVAKADGGPMNCFDFNGDGFIDLVLAVAAYEHPHAISVYDLATHETLFAEKFADQPSVAGVGDVNGDGAQELFLLQEWDSGVDPPVGDYDAKHCYATLFDLQGNRIWKREYTDSLDGCLADLDADGVLDIVLFHMSQTKGAIHILDPASGEPRISFSDMANRLHRFWSVADMTGDGRLEIVCGDGAKVFMMDAGGRVLHNRPSPDTRVAATNDLNGDGHLEVVAFRESNLIVLDRNLTEIARCELPGPIRNAIVSDIDNDGVNEILAVAGPEKALRLEIVRFAPRKRAALPKDIAFGFLHRLRSGDARSALDYVRDEMRAAMKPKLREGEIPPIPKNPRLVVVQNKDGTARVEVENASDVRLELRYTKGQWWVEEVSW